MTNSSSGNPLLTASSVALSLAPPRSPPHGSALKTMYTNPKAALRHLLHARTTNNGDGEQHDDDYQSHTLASRLLQILPHDILHHVPHPHLPNSLSLPDTMTRFLGAVLPLESQHSFRDGGGFKRVADSMVKLTCPLIGVGHPRQAREFLELTYASECKNKGTSRESSNSNTLADGSAKSTSSSSSSSSRGKSRWTRNRIPYGDHGMQFIDLFLPSPSLHNNINHDGSTTTNGSTNTTTLDDRIPVRGTIFFIHGGAWGSGQPWMYRLVAPTFLKLNFAVAIVGYRTYPEAQTIEEQCGDVRLAWDKCESVLNRLITPVVVRNCNSISSSSINHNNRTSTTNNDENDQIQNDNGWVGNVVMGHSSGAHVAMLMLVDMMGECINKEDSSEQDANAHNNTSNNNNNNRYPWKCDFFVGLSGPYDISYHFDYEGGRGVEQISPMKPICGHSRINFDKASPAIRLMNLLAQQRREEFPSSSSSTTSNYSQPTTIQHHFPPTLLVHGIEDSTVPFTATSDAGRILRSCGVQQCDEIYLEETGHQEVVMHFMLGGPAKDLVMDWLLLNCSRQRQMVGQLPQSKL